jgi:hypothetical protein
MLLELLLNVDVALLANNAALLVIPRLENSSDMLLELLFAMLLAYDAVLLLNEEPPAEAALLANNAALLVVARLENSSDMLLELLLAMLLIVAILVVLVFAALLEYVAIIIAVLAILLNTPILVVFVDAALLANTAVLLLNEEPPADAALLAK